MEPNEKFQYNRNFDLLILVLLLFYDDGEFTLSGLILSFLYIKTNTQPFEITN